MGKLSTIANAVAAGLATSGVTTRTGAEHLHTTSAPPLLVWVHTRVPHLPGGDFEGGVIDLPSDGLRRQIGTRRLGVAVHVWAASTDAADLLIEDLSAAAHRVLGTSVAIVGEEWPKQQKHEHLKRGEPVIVAMTIDTPMYDPPLAASPLETTDIETVDPPAGDWVAVLPTAP